MANNIETLIINEFEGNRDYFLASFLESINNLAMRSILSVENEDDREDLFVNLSNLRKVYNALR